MSDDDKPELAQTTRVDRRAPGDSFEDLLREVAETPTMPVSPVEVLEDERYRVVGLLGAGGGGQVYRAYDQQLGREVALKFLNVGGAYQAQELVREARMQARINHPAVCRVYEVVEGRGRPFIAMQLVDGPTLREAAAGLSQAEKIALMRQVAEAVEAAHREGIIHRDLKPANILVERAGDVWRPYVTDFGLARGLDETLSAGMVGTPHYMAPEQARGDIDAIGRPTDVWALGATLYELLAGEPPFDGDSVLTILRQVETAEPVPLPSTVPPELRAIVGLCLQKQPRARYASAEAFARDLAAFERGDPVSARNPWLSRRARRRVLAALGVAACLVGAPLAWRYHRAHRHWLPTVVELLPQYDESAGAIRPSPDGKQLLFTSYRGEDRHAYLQPAGGGPTQLIPQTSMAQSLSWCSAGDAIYFSIIDGTAGAHVKRLSLPPTSAPVPVVDAVELVECAGRLFFLRTKWNGADRIFTIEHGVERELTHSVTSLADIRCSADGNRVAYNIMSVNESVAWLDIHDGREHVLPPLGEASLNPMFHPTSPTLFVSVVDKENRSTAWEQRLDGTAARQLTTAGKEYSPVLARDGRLYFDVGEVARVLSTHPLDGTGARRVGSASMWRSVLPTADGRSIVSDRNKRLGYEIVLITVADDTERVLTDGFRPALSPDEQTLYFVDADGRSVWRMPLAGGAKQLVAQAPGEVVEMVSGVDALHLQIRNAAPWRMPYDGTRGAPEGPPGVRIVLPAADGWTVADGVDYQIRFWPPGPMPSTAPAPTRFSYPSLTADRRAFLGIDDDFAVWLVGLADHTEKKLMRVPRVERVALSNDGKVLYALANYVQVHRAVITNYGDLPPL